MPPAPPSGSQAFSTLRRFAQRRATAEHCELCNFELATEHAHLIDPAERKIVCACAACALLFSDPKTKRYRLVPRRIERWTNFRLSDAQWDELHVPINLAFFFHSSVARKVIGLYPSPAGAIESLLPLGSWHDLEEANPILRLLELDVEALLVNRIGTTCDYYRAPIDECYKLVGLIRTHWKGLSGGAEVWGRIAQFFNALAEHSSPTGENAHA